MSAEHPKIYLLIQMMPPHIDEDGNRVQAAVETISANLPTEYFDIKFADADVELDNKGELVRASWTLGGAPDDARLKYPYDVYERYPGFEEAIDPSKLRETGSIRSSFKRAPMAFSSTYSS
jgi:hypothetical protein